METERFRIITFVSTSTSRSDPGGQVVITETVITEEVDENPEDNEAPTIVDWVPPTESICGPPDEPPD